MNDPLLSLLERDALRLHALLYRITLRDDVAADLLQDLFLRLRDAPGFREAINPSAYARRVATNSALEWRRKRRPTAALETDNDAAVDAVDPLDALTRDEDVGRVLDAIARLPSELYRQCFVLRFIEQDSYDAIALAIGKTPHQARGLCHAAVRQVRELVGVERQVSDERPQ